MAERSEVLDEALSPVVATLGLDLYDVEVVGSRPPRVLRVTIDRRSHDGTSGVDLEAITQATQAITPVLDALAASDDVPLALQGAYTLEVSSPGIERPLRTPAHFAAGVGSLVSVKTRVDGETLRRRGVLVAADDAGIDVELDDGTRDHILLSHIQQARTVFEWGPRPKPGPGVGRAKEHAGATRSAASILRVALGGMRPV